MRKIAINHCSLNIEITVLSCTDPELTTDDPFLVHEPAGIRVVRRYQAEVGLSYRKFTLYLLFFAVLAVSHWLACTLGVIHKFQIEILGSIREAVSIESGVWSIPRVPKGEGLHGRPKEDPTAFEEPGDSLTD